MKGIADSVKDDVKSVAETAETELKGIADSVKDDVKSVAETAETELKGIADSVKDDVKSVAETAETELKGIADSVKDDVKSVAEIAETELKGIADSAKDEVKSVANAEKDVLEGATGSVKTELQEIGNTSIQAITKAQEAENIAAGAAAAFTGLDLSIAALAVHGLFNDGEISVLASKEGDLQDQINNIKKDLDKEKPVQTSTITVQVFDSCDLDNNPVYITRTVSVIQGTEEAEKLKFEQAAIADGATCKIGYGNGFANLLNEVREIGALILNASEQTINTVGTGFNALQDDGILSEENWKYYPPNISLKAGALSHLVDAATVINNHTPKTAANLSEQINTEITNLDTNIKTAITNASTQRSNEIQGLTAPNFSWEDLT
ncbi:hypothetical protein [Nostoc sp.]|uniref:hypothetical protein n=1 Tax=Nostoc sp. TaxID=1180 RepID=UPI002FFB2B97